MIDKMDWNDVRILLQVARSGSTLAAARELGVSQSTVMRRIASFEEILGVEIFDKRRTGYEVKDTLRRLLPQAEQVESAQFAFIEEMKALQRDLSGVVRLTASEVMVSQVLAPALVECRNKHPDLRVEIVSSDRSLDLARGEADVAVRSGRAPMEPWLVGRRVARETWSFYCTRGYAERHGLASAPEDLVRHRVIGVSDRLAMTPMGRWIDAAVPDSGIYLRHNTISAVLASLRSGLGIAPMSDVFAAGDPDLVCCFTPDLPQDNEVWLLTHERLRKQPRIRAVMDALGICLNRRFAGAC